MIKDFDLQWINGQILLGIAVECAVMDVITTKNQLEHCISLLLEPHQGLVYANMGSFGPFNIKLNLHHDDSVSVFIDGPDVEKARNQSAGIYIDRDEILQLLLKIVGSN